MPSKPSQANLLNLTNLTNFEENPMNHLYDTLAQLVTACYFTDTFSFEPCANVYGSIFDVHLSKLGCTVQVKRTKDGHYWPIHN